MLGVEVRSFFRTDGFEIREPYGFHLRDGDPRGVLPVLASQEAVIVDITSSNGASPTPGSYALTIGFADAAGLEWKRTGNDPPTRIVSEPTVKEDRWRRRRKLLKMEEGSINK